MSIKLLRLGAICAAMFGSVLAVDLPVFYRAPLLEGQPGRTVDDWHTQFSIAYLQGSTNRAWDGNGNKGELFDTWGVLDVTKLGKGIQDRKGYVATGWKDDNSGAFESLVFTGNDGKVSLSGHHEAKELCLSARQNLFSGFYAYVHAPIRSVKHDGLTYKHLGTKAEVNTFLSDHLAGILTDYGYEPLTSSFNRTELSDMIVGAGWQGMDATSFEFFDSLGGGGQIGIVVPCAAKANLRYISAIPTGYDGHWGVKAQIGGEIGLWKMFAFGGSTNATMFFRHEHSLRMKTDKDQVGLIALEKGKALVDRGASWQISGYAKVKATNVASVLVGASFARQEKTCLDVRDEEFLKNVVAAANLGTNKFVSQNDIVNADERFQAWEVYTIHVKAAFDMRAKMKTVFAPAVGVEYSCPVAGKHVFINDMVNGSLDASLEWKF